ncbi:hypothetical protein HU200_063434 [Digitaria exilis]|uniref:Uncharacterized protein n=1 Tax=Digitaria exilis TaxID=1010633 RepID=A0A835A6V7_9POAL|nr:hypothetical protein HU200_063434 [Digitaria exilis]
MRTTYKGFQELHFTCDVGSDQFVNKYIPLQALFAGLELCWLGCSQLDCCLWPRSAGGLQPPPSAPPSICCWWSQCWRPSVRVAASVVQIDPGAGCSRPQRPPLRRSSWIQRGRALRHTPAHDGEQGSYLPLAHSSTPSTVVIPAALPDYAKKAEAAEKLAEVMLLFLVLSP